MNIKIEGNSKQRIDKFLAEKLDKPRNQIQKMIKNKLVLVNNVTKSAHYALKENDIIEVDTKEQPQKINKKKYKLDIIFENKNYLIINKPAGISVHSSESSKGEPVLTDLIIKHFPAIKKVGESSNRPGIVHRLDKNVSGILIVAKTPKFYKHIKTQFLERKINKYYTALVHGKIEGDEDTITFPLTRSQENKVMIVALPVNSDDGREAITKFFVEKRFLKYTLLDIQILTGRTHQIRVHFKAYAHPVVGDRKYKIKTYPVDETLNQLFLHAHKLEFTDLKNNLVSYTAKMPKQLNDFLKNIKR